MHDENQIRKTLRPVSFICGENERRNVHECNTIHILWNDENYNFCEEDFDLWIPNIIWVLEKSKQNLINSEEVQSTKCPKFNEL